MSLAARGARLGRQAVLVIPFLPFARPSGSYRFRPACSPQRSPNTGSSTRVPGVPRARVTRGPVPMRSDLVRVTMLAAGLQERLAAHLLTVKRQHERDLSRGEGRVVLPFALDRKSRAR